MQEVEDPGGSKKAVKVVTVDNVVCGVVAGQRAQTVIPSRRCLGSAEHQPSLSRDVPVLDVSRQRRDPPLKVDPRSNPLDPETVIRLPSTTRYSTRTEQCRWLWHWVVHRSQARPGPVPLHFDDTCLELYQPPTDRLKDGFAPGLCPCTRYH
ncbi:hypothetical protein HYQ46_013181 [Verticillium longisporum]|nr:hypothetical protein HYQ46_013181 [Verticillium longisporum]